MLANWSLVPLPFLNPAWTSGSSRFVLLKPGLENFEHYFASIWKWSESEVAQSCPTLWDPVDCSLPGSSIHGIFKARILEWVAISFFRGSSQPRDQTQVSCITTDTLLSEPPGKPSCGTGAQLPPGHVESSQTKDGTHVPCIGRQTPSTLLLWGRSTFTCEL